MRTAVLLVVVGLGGSLAHAGVKAEMLCGVFADGKIKTPLPDKKKAKLDGKVACAIHLGDAKAGNEYLGKISTVRYTIDPKTKKTVKVEAAGISGDISHLPGQDAHDLEGFFEANATDANGQIAFKSCETFDIVGVVGDASANVFKKVIHIEQTCPKPKPIKIEVACEARGDGGKTLKLPTKKKDGLADYQSIVCSVSTTDMLEGPLLVSGTSTWTGFENAKRIPKTALVAATGRGGKWSVAFEREKHWDTCIDVTKLDLTVWIGGTMVASKQVKVEQDCGGGD